MRKNICLLIFALFITQIYSINYSFFEIYSEYSIKPPLSQLDEDWYKNGVFYQIFVRSFYDSNGDGAGDIRGVIEKLDYIESLGVSGIWLLPINENSDGDHGYAVTDYMSVFSSYGTLDDFDLLVKEAHKRGIGIVMDLVINHCSREHPFFMSAVKSKDSPYRDYFIWSDRMEYWRQPWSNRPVWHETDRKDFYYGLFSNHMPDFNFNNKDVYKYMQDILIFWLNRGVNGFRIDAATHIFENGRYGLSDQEETFEFFKGMRFLTDNYKGIYIIGEAGRSEYFGDGTNSLNGVFNFSFAGDFTKAVYHGDASYFTKELKKRYEELPYGGYLSNVLGNHDSFMGPRAASRFRGNIKLIKISASALLTAPGIPYIYYGEEIGMTSDNSYLYDWSLRTPMQWNDKLNSGFSEADRISPRQVNKNYKKVNVENQENDQNSLLNHYRTLIKLRNTSDALKYGDIIFKEINSSLITFVRKYEDKEALVIINISNKSVLINRDVISGFKLAFSDGSIRMVNGNVRIPSYSSFVYFKE